jgi:hypothetical protein
MKKIIERVATALASLAFLGAAWFALYEVLSFGWRA